MYIVVLKKKKKTIYFIKDLFRSKIWLLLSRINTKTEVEVDT